MRKILFLESVAGIAGDMFAASFVDAGLVEADELKRIPALLGLSGVAVKISHVIRATMRATHLDVTWEGDAWKRALGSNHAHAMTPVRSHSHGNITLDGEHWHTHYVDLDRFLERSELEPLVKAFARKVFRIIAEAESEAHGMSIEEIAFHEVGAVDSIVDVVMAAYCLAKVSPVEVIATPVKLGRGMISIAHGTHPVPPPASARIAMGLPLAEVPSAITRTNVELSTPTGLAILKAIKPIFAAGVPAGVVHAQGMGAGTMDLGGYPNVFRVMVLECGVPANVSSVNVIGALPYEADQVTELVCNIDDDTPERVSWLSGQALELGALDAWTQAVTGKKGRVAIQLSLLVQAADFARFADWLLRTTTSFGLRYQTWDRLKLAREFEERKIGGKTVRFKIGRTTAGEKLKEKPEFEDLRKTWEGK